MSPTSCRWSAGYKVLFSIDALPPTAWRATRGPASIGADALERGCFRGEVVETYFFPSVDVLLPTAPCTTPTPAWIAADALERGWFRGRSGPNTLHVDVLLPTAPHTTPTPAWIDADDLERGWFRGEVVEIFFFGPGRCYTAHRTAHDANARLDRCRCPRTRLVSGRSGRNIKFLAPSTFYYPLHRARRQRPPGSLPMPSNEAVFGEKW
ncbi:hypothetical protein C8R46DRAFT_305992 [Mycena filopes]|nr:hypothetical protein C8R46DRAFT_305992 [Mycena filopes]